jgi:hypothetical protein
MCRVRIDLLENPVYNNRASLQITREATNDKTDTSSRCLPFNEIKIDVTEVVTTRDESRDMIFLNNMQKLEQIMDDTLFDLQSKNRGYWEVLVQDLFWSYNNGDGTGYDDFFKTPVYAEEKPQANMRFTLFNMYSALKAEGQPHYANQRHHGLLEKNSREQMMVEVILF